MTPDDIQEAATKIVIHVYKALQEATDGQHMLAVTQSYITIMMGMMRSYQQMIHPILKEAPATLSNNLIKTMECCVYTLFEALPGVSSLTPDEFEEKLYQSLQERLPSIIHEERLD